MMTFLMLACVFCAGAWLCGGEAPVMKSVRGDGAGASETRFNGGAMSSALGDVGHPFRLAARPVTNGEYAAFLNACGADAEEGVWNAGMEIERLGTQGNYRYRVQAGKDAKPVVCVRRVDAARYCNFLTSGRADRGAYGIGRFQVPGGKTATVTSGLRDLTSPQASTVYFLPDVHEWYRGMFLDEATGSYVEPELRLPVREWVESRLYRNCLTVRASGTKPEFASVHETYQGKDLGFRVAATYPLHIGNRLNGRRNIFTKRGECVSLRYRNATQDQVTVHLELRDFYGERIWQRQFMATGGTTGEETFGLTVPDGYYELRVKPEMDGFPKEGVIIPLAMAAEPMDSFARNFGLCAHLGKWEVEMTHEPVSESLKQVALTGAGIIRWDCGFGEVDAERIRAVKAAGFEPLPILCSWIYGTRSYPSMERHLRELTPEISEKWARLNIPAEYRLVAERVWTLLQKTGLKNLTLEMGNEPTFWPIVAEDYVQYLRAGYVAAKAHSSEHQVMMGDINSIFEPVLDNHGAAFCDLAATHIYGYFINEHWCSIGNLGMLRNAFRRVGTPNKRLWVTEGNICTYSAPDLVPAVSTRKAVAYQTIHVPKMLAGNLACGAERVIYYNHRNVPCFTLENQFGLIDANGLPKPAFSAYRTTARLLGNARFAGKIQELPDGIEGFLFLDAQGRDVAVLWRIDHYSHHYGDKVDEIFHSKEDVRLASKAQTAELVDLMGKSTQRVAERGIVTVPVDEAAVFVRGKLQLTVKQDWMPLVGRQDKVRKQPALVKILPPIDNKKSAKMMLPGVILKMKPGKSNQVRVRFYNHTPRTVRGTARLVMHEDWVRPPCWPVTPRESALEIPAESMALKTFEMMVPQRFTDKAFRLRAQLELEDGTLLEDTAIMMEADE